MNEEIAYAVLVAAQAREMGMRPVEAYEAGKKALPDLSSRDFETAIQKIAEAAGL